MRREHIFLLVAGIAVLITASLAFIGLRRTSQPITSLTGQPQILKVTLCYPDFQADKLIRRPLVLSVLDEKHATLVLVELLREPISPSLTPALPPNTRLLNAYREENTFVLDFNPAFADAQYWQGSEIAHLRLQALVRTVTSLPKVKKVRILINGKTPPALGGHEEVSEPIKPDPYL